MNCINVVFYLLINFPKLKCYIFLKVYVIHIINTTVFDPP